MKSLKRVVDYNYIMITIVDFPKFNLTQIGQSETSSCLLCINNYIVIGPA